MLPACDTSARKLTLYVVHFLFGVFVEAQTQKAPFSRATVQLLPDQEITASYYASAAELLAAAPGLVRRRQQEARQWQHTVAHAAAVSSEQHWQLYENARLDLTVTGGVTQTREVTQLCHMSHEAGLENKLSHSVAVHEREAMSEAVRLVAELEQDRASQPAVLGAPVLSTRDLVATGVLGGSQSGASLPLWKGWQDHEAHDTGVVAEEEVHEVERRLWVELDAMLRHLHRLGQGVSIPSQLLGLLPDADAARPWPQDFELDKVARAMTALHLPPRPPTVMECHGQMVGTGRQSAFMRVGPDYAPLRRAQKVSYVAAALLGMDNGSPAQALLEARSTQHRLAMLLKQVIDLNQQLQRAHSPPPPPRSM